MVFSSPIFLFIFLPLMLIIYFFSDKKLKNFVLLLGSLIFYSWGGAKYLILMLFSIIVNYLIGILIGKYKKNNNIKKCILILGVLFNLSILGYFKYFNFFIHNVEHIGKIFNNNFSIMNNKIVLPIGISFFTFQMMSYIIDVYREEVTPQKSIINLGLYIMLFPQLIAGPIVRYIDIEEQINTRKVNLYKFTHGIERFIIGLSKKVLIANSNGFIVDYVFKEPSFYSNTVLVWLGIVCYALQIYYDFSGYSDMAIGLGKMFGFDFLENFNYPYISKSIKEFWRRWHISLSTWFRDYLYIPLGGSRVGKFKTYRNLVIVFFATGLWHGASWNFIIWGLFHGMFLILERGKFGELLKKVPTILQRIYTMLVVLVGWVFFRANNFKLALKYIKGMFKVDFTKVNQIYGVIDKEYMFFIIIGIIFSTPLIKKLNSLFNSKIKTENNLIIVITEGMWIAILMSMFIISILYITGSNFNPFIYFRF